MAKGEMISVTDYAARAAIFAQNTDLGLHAIPLHTLSLGCAHTALALATSDLDMEHIRQAQDKLDLAVDGLRRAGYEWMLPPSLLARAAFRRTQCAFSAAATDLAEALDITSQGEMRLHLTDCHLVLAQATNRT
jgi:hypothetical protein